MQLFISVILSIQPAYRDEAGNDNARKFRKSFVSVLVIGSESEGACD
jgi:hypothetical protein